MNLSKLEITIPKSIRSDFNGYKNLLDGFSYYLDSSSSGNELIINFAQNIWFDANLSPIIYAYVFLGQTERNIVSSYQNRRNSKLEDLFRRNGFSKECFSLACKPKKKESVVPFKIFKAKSTTQFGDYIDEEIVRYFPSMDIDVKQALSNYIQELFGNAQIHGGCRWVYTCGQYYPKKQKMDFTIVNLGTTIKEHVISYLQELNHPVPKNKISWAVEMEHSTKRTSSGGIGLALMKDFVYHNKGKYQIISGNEFWELKNTKITEGYFDNPFPGTIVNIEIDQDDDNYYHLEKIDDQVNLF